MAGRCRAPLLFALRARRDRARHLGGALARHLQAGRSTAPRLARRRLHQRRRAAGGGDPRRRAERLDALLHRTARSCDGKRRRPKRWQRRSRRSNNHGRPVYIVLDAWENEPFRAKFASLPVRCARLAADARSRHLASHAVVEAQRSRSIPARRSLNIIRCPDHLARAGLVTADSVREVVGRTTGIISCLRKFDVIMLAIILLVAAGLRVWAPWDDVLRLGARQFSRDRRVVSRAARREPGPQLSAPRHRRSLRRARTASTWRLRRCSTPIIATAVRSSRRAATRRPTTSSASRRSCRRSSACWPSSRCGRWRRSRSIAAPASSPACWPRSCPATSSIARSSASSITTRSKCCCRSRRWRSHRRTAPAIGAGHLPRSVSARVGERLVLRLHPRGLDRADAPIARAAQRRSSRRRCHRDRGGDRAGDRAGVPGSRLCSATTRRSPRWSGLLAAVAGGDVLCRSSHRRSALGRHWRSTIVDRRRSPGCSLPALVNQVVDRSQSLPSRSHAHGGARGAAAVSLHRQLGRGRSRGRSSAAASTSALIAVIGAGVSRRGDRAASITC